MALPRRTLLGWAGAGLLLVSLGCDVRDEPVREMVERWPGLGPSGGPLVSGAGRDTAIEFVEDHGMARARAGAEGRPLLILFRASWCRHSADMSRGMLLDPEIVRRSRRFICVAVDADRDRDICESYGVTGFPTLLVLSADGTELERQVGAMPPERMAAMLDRSDRLRQAGSGTAVGR